MTRLKVLLIALILLTGVVGCNGGCNGGCTAEPPAKKQDLKTVPPPKGRAY